MKDNYKDIINELGLNFYKERTNKSYNELYDPLRKYFFSYSYMHYKMVNSHSKEDVIDETLIRIWTRIHLFNPSKATFKTWATHILKMYYNEYFHEWHFHNKRTLLPDNFYFVQDEIDKGKFIHIGDVLNEIEDQDQSDVMNDYYLLRLNLNQICEKRKLNKNTVKTRMRASRIFLVNKLKNKTVDDYYRNPGF